MNDTFEIRDDQINVEEIMAEIRRKVAERKAQGLYTDDEVGAIAEMELEVPGPQDHPSSSHLPDDWYSHYLDRMEENWEARRDIQITSHRPVTGRFIISAKKLIRRLMRPYTNMILARQADFNINLLILLKNFVRLHSELWSKLNSWNEELRRTTSTLEKTCSELKGTQEGLISAQDELRSELEGLRSVQDGVRSSLEGLKNAQEGLGARIEDFHQETTLQKRRIDDLLSDMVREGGGDGKGEIISSHRKRLMDHCYYLFEQSFRGGSEDIKERQRGYVPLFQGHGPVLDVGCGRGEFLELLKEEGVEGIGIDISEDMVHRCLEKGLRVEREDLFNYLPRLEDGVLGGIFSSQVIEHFPTDEVVELMKLFHRKLRAGGILVVETVNPACLSALANFYLDMDHKQPIHPEALKFLLSELGFSRVDIRYLSPVDPKLRLEIIPEGDVEEFCRDKVDFMNSNFRKLNDLIYSHQDYAAVAEK